MAAAAMDDELEKNKPGAWAKALSGTFQPIQNLTDSLTPSNFMQASMGLADRGRIDSFGRKTLQEAAGAQRQQRQQQLHHHPCPRHVRERHERQRRDSFAVAR